jgi:hypothetical protein
MPGCNYAAIFHRCLCKGFYTCQENSSKVMKLTGWTQWSYRFLMAFCKAKSVLANELTHCRSLQLRLDACEYPCNPDVDKIGDRI